MVRGSDRVWDLIRKGIYWEEKLGGRGGGGGGGAGTR